MQDDTAPAPPTAVAPTLPQLSAIEARILGCLIEKAALTPDVYPLTENATVAACNQKTSREPVMQLELGEIAHALRRMAEKNLVRLDPGSQRAQRWAHRFDSAYGVTPRQTAVLSLLLLRGAQTLHELFARSERLADFPGIDDLRDTLDRLIQREPPLIVRLPRSAGRREERYMHLLCGPVAADAFVENAVTPAPVRDDLHERVERLEAEVAELRAQITALQDAHAKT